MIQTAIGRTTGLSVPNSLLRIHDARDERGPAPPTSYERPPAVDLRQSISGLGAVLAALAATGAIVDGALIGRLARVQHDLHTTASGAIGLLVVLAGARLVAGAAVGPLAHRAGRRRFVAGAGIAGAVLTALMATASSVGAAGVLAIAVGVATAPIGTAHVALLTDTTPRGGWAQAIGLHTSARAAGLLLAAAVASLAGWRVAMVLGLAGVIPALLAFRSSDPTSHPKERPAVTSRLTRLRSRTAVTGTLAVAGFAGVGLLPVLESFFTEHHIALAAQGRVLAVAVAVAAVAAALAGRLGDRRDRAQVAVGGLVVLAAGLGLTALASSAGSATATLAVAAAGLAATVVATAAMICDVVPGPVRVDGLGLAGLVAAFWGLSGAVVASAARSAWGPGGVLAALGAATLGAAALLLAGRPQVIEDMGSAVLEAEERSAAGRRSAGTPLALSVSHVSFGYGTQPVLFDVSLEVPDGEIAALLGTNGAGKSTLLRLVAGLDHPHRGTIRLFGEDATFLEAEQVLDTGVALLSGGRMTFPGLTVAENIRAGTQAIRRTARARTAEDDAYAAFPVLAERREQRAGTLSGGEQQMLALARILIQKPRLLLLDELTLGLAPRIIEDLLATVRALNADGTTIVLVEQSANLALALAGHAFFMERGAVRFDGPAAELAGRDDLLRPVFLGGDAPEGARTRKRGDVPEGARTRKRGDAPESARTRKRRR